MKTQHTPTTRLTQTDIAHLKKITREERIQTWKRLIDTFGIEKVKQHSFTIKKALDMRLIGEVLSHE